MRTEYYGQQRLLRKDAFRNGQTPALAVTKVDATTADSFVNTPAAVRCDVLFKLHSSAFAGLVCFGHDRSQRVVFVLCWRTLVLDQPCDRLGVLAYSNRKLLREPSAILARAHVSIRLYPSNITRS
jgi:hypothetical protein